MGSPTQLKYRPLHLRRRPETIAVLLLSGLLTGAVTFEAPGPEPEFGVNARGDGGLLPPGINRFGPAQSLSDLTPQERESSARVQELVTLARQELASAAPGSAPNSRKATTTGSALFTLGLLYYHGLHLPPDKAQAQQLFIRSRQLGNDLAAIALAWCYLDGCDSAPNEAAFRKILPAAKARSSRRTNYILYEHARRQSSSADSTDANAKKFLTRSAKAGDRFALNELGLLNIENDDISGAIDAFEKSARRGSSVATKNLAIAQRVLLNKSLVTENNRRAPQASSTREQASKTYNKARELHRQARSLSDYAQVIELYRSAAMHGHQAARQMLSLILSRPTPGGTIDPAWMKQTSLVRIADGSATTIGVSGESFEREVSPLIDLLPPAFEPRE